ncbi:probable CCR4-associated factor 1 homolog 11 [Cicer arietinum]|uniref:Probable CCR4-associated factor 1 homolog 11 n=1 Tax=Cicer arietinum TaxID=3827 RepID=A0A1S3E9N5_CICAR|nr:probable CCR4-associated factor 1 homolog 11 [Cicer arietinum]
MSKPNQEPPSILIREVWAYNLPYEFYLIREAIDSARFGEMLIMSGLVFNKSVVWVTFHSAYDFGYLVKALTRQNLPDKLEDFLYVVRNFFGDNVYDIKHVVRFCNALYGGLERVASVLNVSRSRTIGEFHQTASDSLLT